MGAVYTLGIQQGTVIRNNLIHDVESFTYGGWGLYTDEGSSGILLENNVVYHCKSAGFHQHYGHDKKRGGHSALRAAALARGHARSRHRQRNERHTTVGRRAEDCPPYHQRLMHGAADCVTQW
jgi:hypothetical protein